jgi:hypothetical protein
VVEGAADAGARVLHLTDVMEADVPLVSRAAEGVSVTAGLVVALENEHAFAAVLSKQDRGGQASYARADDDGVPVVGECGLLVGSSDGHVLVLQIGVPRVNVDIDNISVAENVATVNIP